MSDPTPRAEGLREKLRDLHDSAKRHRWGEHGPDCTPNTCTYEFALTASDTVTTEPFKPDYDWTSTCPHEGEAACPDGDDGCRCECHAVPER